MLPIGGAQITNDIAMVPLQVPVREAELLKCRYGRAHADAAAPEAEANVSDPELPAVSLPVLNQIVTARVEEIADLAARELRASASRAQVAAGIVLTGGSSQLPGLAETLREALCMLVRVADPAQSEILTAPGEAPLSAARWAWCAGAPSTPRLTTTWRSRNNGAALQNHYHRIKSWLRTFVA